MLHKKRFAELMFPVIIYLWRHIGNRELASLSKMSN